MKKLALLLHSKIFIAVTLSVVAAVSVAAAVVLSDRSAKEDVYRIIKVFEMSGTASVSRADVGEITPYVGMNLENGDILATYAESTMRLSLDSDKFLLMEENTEIELTATGDETDSQTKIILKSGAVLNEILKPLSERSNYEIYTPKATMAVRGTSYRVNVYKDTDGSYITILDVFNGNVKVSLIDENGSAKGQSVMVPESRRVIIKTDPNKDSGQDATIDGNSYFVYEADDGSFKPIEKDMSPLSDIVYEDISYKTLYQVYSTDQTDDLKLDDLVLSDVIYALFGGDGTVTGEVQPGEPAGTEKPEKPETEKPITPEDPGKPGAPSHHDEDVPPEEPENPGASGADGGWDGFGEIPGDADLITDDGDDTPPADEDLPEEPGEEPADEDIVTEAPDDSGDVVTTAPDNDDEDTTSAPEDETDETTVSEEETTAPPAENDDTTTTTVTEQTTAPPYHGPSSGDGDTTTQSPETEPTDTEPTGSSSYTVTFYTRGTSISSQVIIANGVVEKPADPEREGYTFVGWEVNGEPYDFTTPVTGDITIDAVWEINTYTVTFDSGDTKTEVTVKHDYQVERPDDPEREGYVFAGWYYNGEIYSFNSPVKQDMVITASWREANDTPYKVKHYQQKITGDGYDLADTDELTGTTGSKTEAVAKSYDGFTVGTVTQQTIAADGSTEVVILYTRDVCTVSFDLDGGTLSGLGDTTVKYGGRVSDPGEPEKTGYTFVGWTLNGTEYDFDEPVTENFTLRAKWDITKITVTIDAGPYTSKAKAEVDYGSKLEKPSDPVWDTGYKFVEWQKDGTAYDFSEPVTEAFTLTAQWKVQVSVDYGPTSGVAVMMVTRGDTISEPSEPEWEGYEFAGWRKIIGTDITMYDFSEPVTEPFALSALWKVTVTIDKADGSAVTSQKVNYADKLEKPDDPEREHYDFIEWRKDGDAYDFDAPVSKSFTLKAAWSPKSYSVVFADGDDIIDEQSVVYGTAATAPDWTGYRAEGEGSDRVKYKSSGWDKDFSNVTGDMEIHPVFGVEAPKYNVRFVTEGGVGSMPVYEGDEATMPKEAEKTIGFYDNKVYTFKGWKDKNDDPVTDFTIWEDTTFTADYDIGNTAAEITLVADGEVIVPEDGFKNGTTVYAETGTTVTLPEYAAETGYNFGWFKATSGLMTDPDDMNINYDDVYTSFTVSEDSLSNCYQGGSYTTIEFRSYSADETVGGTASASDIRTVLLYNGSYYIGHGGYWFADVEADRGIYIEGGSREDLTMADFTYRLKNGTDITFDQLYSGKRYADVSFAYYQEPKSTVTLVYCSDDGTVQTQQYGAASGSAITHPDPSPYNSSYYVTWYRADPSMADNAEELNLYLDKSYDGMYYIDKPIAASTSAVSEDNDENVYVAVNWRSDSVDLKVGSVSIPAYVLYYNGHYYTGYSDGRGSFSYNVMANDATNIVHLTTGEEYTWKYLYENGMLESALDSAEYIE